VIDQAHLHRNARSKEGGDRLEAARSLGLAFKNVPDKEQAWKDLISLIKDEDSWVQSGGAVSLGLVYTHAPNKKQAWEDLHRLTQDERSSVRWGGAISLGLAFMHVPNKEQAWEDLHRLTQDERSSVRLGAAYSLSSAFPHVPNKEQAWEDLHRLTQDKNYWVRRGGAISLGLAFVHFLDRQHAWEDLRRLTQDKNSWVRWGAAYSLESAFVHIPDKEQAWNDLLRMTQDEDSWVRSLAFYSLGRASIFKARNVGSDEDLKKNLLLAIDFFDKSSRDGGFDPARFCLPFYRSFFIITFQRDQAKSDVNSYLAEAKEAIEQSKSKEILLEAIESLVQALQNFQLAKDAASEERRLYLDAFDQSCARATGLLAQAEDHSPGAVEIVRKGLLIVDRDLKAALKDIEEDSAKLRNSAKNTPFQAISARAAKKIEGLSTIKYEFNAETIMDDVVPDIRVMCGFLPEKSRNSVCQLENWEILSIKKKVPLIKRAISHCSNQMENFSKQIQDKDEQINYLRKEILARLDNINHHVFRLSIQSSNAAQSLRILEYELEKIKKIKSDLDRLSLKMDDLGIHQQKALQELHDNMPRILDDLKNIAENLDNPRMQEILDKLQALKKSRVQSCFDRVYFGQVADVVSVVSLLLYIVDKLASSGAILLPK
jgi:HEAT repeat protein